MSLDELKQALEKQKYNNAEQTYLEVIGRALEVPEGLVGRILYAYLMLTHYGELSFDGAWKHFPFEDMVEGPELRAAIDKAMRDGLRRLAVVHTMRNPKVPLYIPVEHLVPEDQKHKLCNGCPELIPCLAETRSTPAKCYTGEHRALRVKPLRIVGDMFELEATQPAGRYTVPLTAIFIRGDHK